MVTSAHKAQSLLATDYKEKEEQTSQHTFQLTCIHEGEDLGSKHPVGAVHPHMQLVRKQPHEQMDRPNCCPRAIPPWCPLFQVFDRLEKEPEDDSTGTGLLRLHGGAREHHRLECPVPVPQLVPTT